MYYNWSFQLKTIKKKKKQTCSKPQQNHYSLTSRSKQYFHSSRQAQNILEKEHKAPCTFTLYFHATLSTLVFFFHLSKLPRPNIKNLGRIRGLWIWIISIQIKFSLLFHPSLMFHLITHFHCFYSKNISEKQDLKSSVNIYLCNIQLETSSK